MEEDKKYMEELELLKQQRVAENEKSKNELLLEKQRTKTEKAKQGKGKMIIRLISAVTLLLVGTVIATWIISMFLPEQVEKALNIFINIL